MRLVTFVQEGVERIGAIVGEHVLALDAMLAQLSARAADAGVHAACDMSRLLWLDGPGLVATRQCVAQAQASGVGAHPRLDEVALLAPVTRPGKIVAVGRNYADHAVETGVNPFEKPRIISKLPSSVCGPGSIVQRPAGVHKLDYEVELAVVMGAPAKRVDARDALAYVAGYTILNDVSAREFQFDVSPPQTTFAKSMDMFCPMGPWLVTPDDIPDPQALELTLHLNGTRMQAGHTRDMIFPVATLIEYVSQFMTLEPGDVIATGTPSGVGAFRKPPSYLQPGDRLQLVVSRIGVLEHSIA